MTKCVNGMYEKFAVHFFRKKASWDVVWCVCYKMEVFDVFLVTYCI